MPNGSILLPNGYMLMPNGIKMVSNINQYDVIILTVAHDEFIKLDLNALKNQKESVVYDLKSVLDLNQVDARL